MSVPDVSKNGQLHSARQGNVGLQSNRRLTMKHSALKGMSARKMTAERVLDFETYLLERMFYDHCTICVWYTGEQVSDGSICLFVDLLLGLRNWFDFIGAITTRLRDYYCFSNNLTGFVDDNFTEMVPCSMYMFGYLRLLFLLGLNVKLSDDGTQPESDVPKR